MSTTRTGRSKDARRLATQQRRRPGHQRLRTVRRAVARETGQPFVPQRPAARYLKWTPRTSSGRGEPILAGFTGSIRQQIREAMAGRLFNRRD